jgi:ZIP family zinc transporter
VPISTYGAVLALSLLSVITTALGVWLASLIRENDKAIAIGIGFSSGIMLSISGVELVPQAYEAIGTPSTALTVLSGAGLLWLANFAIPHIHLASEHGHADVRLVSSVQLVVMGLILHDIVEGLAMANSFIASPSLGILVAVAIALHNLPEELAMALPAMTLRSRRFLIGAAVWSALAEPVGAIAGLLATSANAALNPFLLAFAAGAMIFVSLHELMPMAQRYGRIGWFIAGLALSLVVHRLLAWTILSESYS